MHALAAAGSTDTAKTALVTGANSGIGFITVKELAKQGYRVVMACRDVDKAQAAKAKILQEAPSAKIEVQYMDLADLATIRAFTDKALAFGGHLDLLINNAGAFYGSLAAVAWHDAHTMLSFCPKTCQTIPCRGHGHPSDDDQGWLRVPVGRQPPVTLSAHSITAPTDDEWPSRPDHQRCLVCAPIRDHQVSRPHVKDRLFTLASLWAKQIGQYLACLRALEAAFSGCKHHSECTSSRGGRH